MVLCTLLTEVGPDKSRYGEIGIRTPLNGGAVKGVRVRVPVAMKSKTSNSEALRAYIPKGGVDTDQNCVSIDGQ